MENKVDLSCLNEEQLVPTLDCDGAILVTAGAGSGKTRLLTYRICHIIGDLGVDPTRILAITFTNKAAGEMRERITNMLGEDLSKRIWISTFHSMCVRILRENTQYLEGYDRYFTIYDTNDSEKLVLKIIKDLNLNAEDLKKETLYHISNAKNEGLSPSEYLKLNSATYNMDKICDIYARYQEELKKNNAFDFDDLILRTIKLFNDNPEVLEYYSDKFMYIHVDEFQDTNTVQYTLVKMLSTVHKNVFVVGDEDQCIYGWRGANIANINNFLKDFGARCYKLERNYRSTKSIISKANLLIKNNSSRIDKTLWTDNDEGEKITYFEAFDESGEAEYVVQNILNRKNMGQPLSSIAILSRVSALTMQFEQKLLAYNIPYIIYGNTRFFDRAIIKNLLAYLKVLINPKDNVSMQRIINFPKRGIGDMTVAKLIESANSKGQSLLEYILDIRNSDLGAAIITKMLPVCDLFIDLQSKIDSMSPSDFVKEVIKVANIKEEYKEDTEENHDILLNIDTFINNIISFEKYNDGATISDYVTSVTLENSYEDSDGDKVIISTIHAAKGLEFDTVYIVGLEENIFPISRAIDSPSDMEEERRLMYVATTRAKKKLYITRAKSRYLYGGRNYTTPSRFVKEMDLIKAHSTSFDTRKDNYNSSLSYFVSGTPHSDSSSLDKFLLNAKAKKEKQKVDFNVGDRVRHTRFGDGVIVSLRVLSGDTYATIDFDSVGAKQLAIRFAPITKIE